MRFCDDENVLPINISNVTTNAFKFAFVDENSENARAVYKLSITYHDARVPRPDKDF